MIETLKTYYSPVFNYLAEVVNVAKENGMLSLLSATLISISHFILKIWEIEFFGVSNLLLLLVTLTVFVNTYTGIKKSKMKAQRALSCLRKMGYKNQATEKYNRCRVLYKENKFDKKKLNFVFFKMFTFLGYLFFAKVLLQTDSDNFLQEALLFTSGLILKVPTAWFWYTEFKSIGENSVVLYGKKAQIFDITEAIFEAKILKHIK